MPLSDPELWSRLQAMPIGPDRAAMSFAGRLARDNDWRMIFAARVVEEYRRFLYLCHVAGQPVTPSDAVDQAWHLHLTYTRSYWDDLCGTMLGRPLHHGPTGGGPDERRKYDAQYRVALGLYTREFGEAPPVDIWPEAAVRFGRTYVRIDRDAVWLIDRSVLRSCLQLCLAGIALCLGLAACAQIVNDLRSLTLLEATTGALVFGGLVWGLGRSVRTTPEKRDRRRDDGGGGGGCGDCGCGGGCD